MTNRGPVTDDDDPPPEADCRPWPDWPCCPRCGRRREAVCPYCRTTGDGFLLADPLPAAAPLHGTRAEANDPSEEALVRLLCPLCSEPQTPQFLCWCRGCGYEFPDGVEPAKKCFDRATKQALGLFLATLALVAAILLYFRHVLQRCASAQK